MPRNASGPAMPSRGNSQTIAFGLVNVPVKIKPLKETRAKTTVAANLICPQHQEKLKTHRYCETGDHYVDPVKAYDVNGVYVQLDDDVLDQIVAAKTGELRIDQVVDLAEIDPIYFDKSYLVYPDGGGSTHDLLAAALRDAGQAAVGSAVFGGSKATTLVVIRWSDATQSLIAHSCLYDDAIRWADVDLVAQAGAKRPAPPAAQVKMAGQVIDALKGTFDPTAVVDEYTPALRDAIAQAAAGVTPTVKQPTAVAATQADDLMETLRQSVQAAKAGKAAAPKKAPAKKKTVKS